MLTMRRLTNTDIVKQLSVIIFFIITSLLFFFPVLKGKKILQNDIVQYSGMSKELKDFRDKNDEETYWVNNAFSGMPTYQLGACLLYTSPSPRDKRQSRMPSSA